MNQQDRFHVELWQFYLMNVADGLKEIDRDWEKLKEFFEPSLFICGPSDFLMNSKQSLTSEEERNVWE